MTKPKFVTIKAPEFETALPEGWRRGYKVGTLELIYDYPVSDEFVVRVLSSIWSGRTRPKAEDTIRVMVYHAWEDRPYIVLKRVYRQSGWQEKLGERVRQGKAIIKTDRWPYCGICGGRMRLLKNSVNRSKFWGCSRYSETEEGCKGSAQYKETYCREK